MTDTWGTRIKPDNSTGFLKKEDDFYLLLESGDKIIISIGESWNTRVKP